MEMSDSKHWDWGKGYCTKHLGQGVPCQVCIQRLDRFLIRDEIVNEMIATWLTSQPYCLPHTTAEADRACKRWFAEGHNNKTQVVMPTAKTIPEIKGTFKMTLTDRNGDVITERTSEHNIVSHGINSILDPHFMAFAIPRDAQVHLSSEGLREAMTPIPLESNKHWVQTAGDPNAQPSHVGWQIPSGNPPEWTPGKFNMTPSSKLKPLIIEGESGWRSLGYHPLPGGPHTVRDGEVLRVTWTATQNDLQITSAEVVKETLADRIRAVHEKWKERMIEAGYPDVERYSVELGMMDVVDPSLNLFQPRVPESQIPIDFKILPKAYKSSMPVEELEREIRSEIALWGDEYYDEMLAAGVDEKTVEALKRSTMNGRDRDAMIVELYAAQPWSSDRLHGTPELREMAIAIKERTGVALEVEQMEKAIMQRIIAIRKRGGLPSKK